MALHGPYSQQQRSVASYQLVVDLKDEEGSKIEPHEHLHDHVILRVPQNFLHQLTQALIHFLSA